MTRVVNSDLSTSIGWYVHLPFCTSKCGYCDFYSLPTQPERIDDLVRAVRREIALRAPARPIRTVFIGGGTPTVLPPDALRAILDAVSERVQTHSPQGDVEFTCEANPSSTDEMKLELLRAGGVNRVSFGAQSFDTGDLRVLQRLHDPSHIPEAVAAARRAGFDNLNLDLIYGVPGQTIESWKRTLAKTIELTPEHISCYSLMYEPGTAMTKERRLGLITPCDEDVEAEMFEQTVEQLAAAGYEQYEISNFAKPGRHCRHNEIYWNNEEYLGVGPSAVSYLDGVRQKNVPDVKRYVEAWADAKRLPADMVVEREELEAEATARETAVQMLRLTSGIDVGRFSRQTGFDARRLLSEAIERHVAGGLLEANDHVVRLTRTGQLLANRVMADFL